MRTLVPSLSAVLAVAAVSSLLASSLSAQRGRRGGLEGWINEDIGRGVAESKRTGKPLMVVFRCPP